MRKLLFVLPLFLVLGCATIGKIGNPVIAVTDVVSASMKSWAHLSVTGQTTKEFDTKVIAAHDQYRAAAAVAQASVIAYKNTGNESDYLKALEAARAGAIPLIDLITSILSPPKAASLKSDLQKASKL